MPKKRKNRMQVNSEHITLLVTKPALKSIAARCEQLSVSRSEYLRGLVARDLATQLEAPCKS